jgi:hypothetical protein
MEALQVLVTQGSLNAILIDFVDICGIDNHEITSTPLVTAGAVTRPQRGDVILIMHQYAYHPQQGRLIHSLCQLESFGNDGNDKLIHIPGGLQCIQTVDGYVFPLSIQDGLPYLGMRPYTDVGYNPPPHVILTTNDVDGTQDFWILTLMTTTIGMM